MTFQEKDIIIRKSPFFLLLLLCFFMIAAFVNTPFPFAHASEKSKDYPRIYDKAGLLSTSEAKELEDLCTEEGNRVGIEIMILTHNDPNAEDAETYIEDFDGSLPAADRVILLIDMANHTSYIEAYGRAATYIHSYRIDSIIKKIRSPLSGEDYVKAFKTYITLSANDMTDDTFIDTKHDYSHSSADSLLFTWWFQLIVSLAVGAITVGIMAYRSGGRMTTGSNTYMDNDHSGLIGRRDQYISTRITRIRKPQNNNSSGGGFQGGVSSSGRSHSSGGGGF